MSEVTQGMADCPSCGARAQVLIDDETFRLGCDNCGFELRGKLSEADRSWLATPAPSGGL